MDNKEEVRDFVENISPEMSDYIERNPQSEFVLFYKYITHSDIGTFGKATAPNSHDKNLLYYLKTNEMLDIESITKKPFQTAHQSCIGLKEKLYDMVGLPQPRLVDQYLINDFMNVYLVNKNLEYFTSEYTQKIFNLLGKSINPRSRSWDFNNLNLKLSDGEFTPIELHCAVHGLGVAGADDEFHKLRHHIFRGDTFVLLFELTEKEKNMFILLEKNPAFYSILGKINKSYEEHLKRVRKRLVDQKKYVPNNLDPMKSFIDDEITRRQQAAWRKMLANEMMGYTQIDGRVFCPLTYIGADFESLGALFVASHIKGFSDPETTNEEKYDINNGMLLSANADALFDKHLISIDENKNLVFSYLLSDDILKQQLLLLHPIFAPILNENRMKYLKYHYQVFQKKEEERKK